MSSTYYIHPLNQDSSISHGLSIGAIEAQETLNGSTITGSASMETVLNGFKFHTTPDNDNSSSVPQYFSGHSLTSAWTPLNKNITSFVNGSIGTPTSGNHQEVLRELSRSVFGDPDAIDLFSNISTINSSIISATSTMLTAVNYNQHENPVRALGNGMLYRNPQRFALKYRAVTESVTLTSTHGNNSIYKNCLVTGPIHTNGTSGSYCRANVTVTNGAVTYIELLSKAGGAGSGTFGHNEEITFSDPSGNTNLYFKYNTLNNTNVLIKLNDANGHSGGLDLITNNVQHISDLVSEGGVYTQVRAEDTNNTKHALCTVRLSSTGDINQISVTTVANSPFSIYDRVNFIGGAGTGVDLKIDSINPVQVAYFNGTLDSTSGTSFPFEANDVIKIKYTLNNHPSQHVVGSNNIVAKMKYSYYVDYVVAAPV